MYEYLNREIEILGEKQGNTIKRNDIFGNIKDRNNMKTKGFNLISLSKCKNIHFIGGLCN